MKRFALVFISIALPAFSQGHKVNACAQDGGGFTVTTFSLSACAGTTTGAGGSLNHTAGNFLFLAAGWEGANCAAAGTVTVSNAAGDTFIPIDSVDGSRPWFCIKTFYVQSTKGSTADYIKLTTTSPVFAPALAVEQWSGMPSSPLDVHGVFSVSSGAVNQILSPDFTTAEANEVIFGVGMARNFHCCTAGYLATLTPDAIDQSHSLAIEYWPVTSLQTNVAAGISTALLSSGMPASDDIGIVVNSFKTLVPAKTKALVPDTTGAIPSFCAALARNDCTGLIDAKNVTVACVFPDASCGATLVPVDPTTLTATGAVAMNANICVFAANMSAAPVSMGFLGTVPQSQVGYSCTP